MREHAEVSLFWLPVLGGAEHVGAYSPRAVGHAGSRDQPPDCLISSMTSSHYIAISPQFKHHCFMGIMIIFFFRGFIILYVRPASCANLLLFLVIQDPLQYLSPFCYLVSPLPAHPAFSDSHL